MRQVQPGRQHEHAGTGEHDEALSRHGESGRLGGVDEWLIQEGRLRPLTDPRALDLHKRDTATATRVRRDPGTMLELLLSALP